MKVKITIFTVLILSLASSVYASNSQPTCPNPNLAMTTEHRLFELDLDLEPVKPLPAKSNQSSFDLLMKRLEAEHVIQQSA